MFSQLRQGSVIYILEKGEQTQLRTGQVVSVSQPQPMYNTQNPTMMIGMQPEMVVDVTVKADGKEYDLKQLHAGLSIEARPDISCVISDNREAMLQEVESIQTESRQVIDSEPYHKARLKACEQIVRQLNPNYEKEQRRDEQLEELSKRFDNFESKFSRVMDKILATKE